MMFFLGGTICLDALFSVRNGCRELEWNGPAWVNAATLLKSYKHKKPLLFTRVSAYDHSSNFYDLYSK